MRLSGGRVAAGHRWPPRGQSILHNSKTVTSVVIVGIVLRLLLWLWRRIPFSSALPGVEEPAATRVVLGITLVINHATYQSLQRIKLWFWHVAGHPPLVAKAQLLLFSVVLFIHPVPFGAWFWIGRPRRIKHVEVLPRRHFPPGLSGLDFCRGQAYHKTPTLDASPVHRDPAW